MTKRAEEPIGAPTWIDLMTSDTTRSREFYGSLFGWTAEEPNPEYGGYFAFLGDGGEVAGCMATPAEMPGSDVWSVYLAVEDARKSAGAAKARGATVVAEARDVGDLGTMAVLVDPGGAGFGLWQRKEHRGFASVYEDTAPSWFELITRDYESTLEFYRDVFGWETRTVADTPEFRYTVLVDGEEQLAGVMDARGARPGGGTGGRRRGGGRGHPVQAAGDRNGLDRRRVQTGGAQCAGGGAITPGRGSQCST